VGELVEGRLSINRHGGHDLVEAILITQALDNRQDVGACGPSIFSSAPAKFDGNGIRVVLEAGAAQLLTNPSTSIRRLWVVSAKAGKGSIPVSC
jgi:hypothetical protein